MIRDFAVTRVETATTSPVFNMPTSRAGDKLLLILGGLSAPSSTPSGWTLLDSWYASWPYLHVYYKTAGASEASTQTVSYGNSSTYVGLIISGKMDGLNAFGELEVTTPGAAFQSPACTTTVDNCQIFHLVVTRFYMANPGVLTGQGIDLIQELNATTWTSQAGLICRTQGQPTAGACQRPWWYPVAGTNQSYIAVTLAFAPQTNAKPLVVSGGQTASQINLGSYPSQYASITPVALSTYRSTLAGKTVVDGGTMTVTHAAEHVTMVRHASTKVAFSSVAADRYFGFVWDHAAETVTDYQSLLFSTTYDAANTLTVVGIYLEDGSGNWVAREVINKTTLTYYNASPIDAWHFSLSSCPIIDQSASLPTLTNIVRRGFFQYCSALRANRTIQFSNWANVSPLTISGGTAETPITSKLIRAALNSGQQYYQATLAGQSQRISKKPFYIGDGTIDTVSNLYGDSWEQPTAAVVSYVGKAYTQNVYFYPTTTLNVPGSTFQTLTAQYWGAHPSATSGTINATGCIVQNYNIVNNNGVALNGFTAYKCPKIVGNGGTFDDIDINNSLDATHAMSISAGAAVTNSAFTKRLETYALDITEAGAYNLSSTTFSGYTKPLHITATTGTVTISLARGQSVPTYDTAGATVVFSQPQNTASLTGIVAGSRLQVYNQTTATQIANEIVSGTSWSLNYTEGDDFSEDDVIRIRLTKAGASTGKKPFETRTIATSTGWAALATQEDATIYNSIGIDGSTVTEFEEDYPNVQIDIDDPDGTTTVQRLFAWWRHIETTEGGIANWFGGLDADDSLNFRIYTDVLDLKLDNISASPVMIIGGRLYRDDGTTVIGSGAIQLDPDKAYSVETGVSGLTAQESEKLNNLDAAISSRLAAASYTTPPTAAANATAVRNELATELGRVDAAVSTRLAASGYTAPANADIASIKTKVDLNLDAKVSEVGGGTAPTVEQIRTEMDANSTKLTAIKAKTDNLPALPAATGDIPTANITAIKAKTDNLPADPASNTQVNTRMATFTYTAPDNASITAIKAKTDNLPASPAATTDIPTANITAIKAKTDNLPASPAAVSDIPTAAANASAVRTNLTTELGRIDANVSADSANITAIKAKTDNLPVAPAAVSDIPTAAANASAVRTELTTELTKINNQVNPDNTSITAIKVVTDAIPAALDALPTATENATQVRTELTTELAVVNGLPASIDAVADSIKPVTPKRGVQLPFNIFMASSADHIKGKTGLTISLKYSKDGAALADAAIAITELSGGMYTMVLTADMMNCTMLLLQFSATGADTRNITIYTHI